MDIYKILSVNDNKYNAIFEGIICHGEYSNEDSAEDVTGKAKTPPSPPRDKNKKW